MENKNLEVVLRASIEVLDIEALDQIRGGAALIQNEEKEQSKEGDGAQYVCCIKL